MSQPLFNQMLQNLKEGIANVDFHESTDNPETTEDEPTKHDKANKNKKPVELPIINEITSKYKN